MTGNNNKSRKNSGFTLMEILVVLGISVVLMTAIVNVFLLSLRAQRQASDRQNILLTSRALIENIARQIRVSEVDFGVAGDGKYDEDEPGIVDLEKELYLIDLEGRSLRYYQDVDGAIKLAVKNAGSAIEQETTLVDPARLTVTRFNILLQPTGDPFTVDRCNGNHAPSGCTGASICTIDFDEGKDNLAKTGFCECSDNDGCATGNCVGGICQSFDIHPRVTVAIEFESVGGGAVTGARRINLQSTVSSRIYKR